MRFSHIFKDLKYEGKGLILIHIINTDGLQEPVDKVPKLVSSEVGAHMNGKNNDSRSNGRDRLMVVNITNNPELICFRIEDIS